MSIIAREVIASYPNLAEPRSAAEGQEPKYSLALLFTEGQEDQVTALKKAAIKVGLARFGAKGKAMAKQGKFNPFHEDEETIEAKGYDKVGCIAFINVRRSQKAGPPGVVSRVPDPENDGKPTVIDAREIFAGCVVNVSLSPYAYDVSGNRGATFGLGNVQFVAKGEVRLDNFVEAEDEFSADADLDGSLEDLEADVEGVDEDEAEEGDDELDIDAIMNEDED